MIASVITGTTLILGLLIHNNDYTEWTYIGAILLGIINLYFFVIIISRILHDKTRTILL